MGVVAYEVVGGYRREVPEHEDQDEVLGHCEPDHGAHEHQDKELKPDGVLLRPIFVMQM